ncbi:MAG: hypothetical protein HZB83_07865, partial [Deltaproteobacteria bacterium]|nr:hypothetical protein [Deltaproteobacteria bacterium]
PASVRPGVASSPAEELYGDQTLSWWVENFRLKRQALQDLESSYAAKKQYAGVFEGGRRMGQIFGAAEVDTYEKYKKQIPEDEKKLETLKDDIEEFRRKAEINGVPKEIRGE